MSLARKILDIFCNSGTSDIGIFGSKYNGSSDVSTDPDDIQRGQGGNNTNWAEGWARAIVTNQAPCLEDMNGVMYVLSYMTKYLYQNGLAEWDASEGYGLYAMTQYGGSLYMCIQVDPLYSSLNINHNPSSSPTWWRPMVFTTPWVAGTSYSVGDVVNYNGRTYKCVSSGTSSSLFENDFYNGMWDDGNPAGTMVQSISWAKSTKPYGYFDVTGVDAGKEISQSTYSRLYNVLGNQYANCVNYSAGTVYGNPASGNFRLPDFRSTYFKNAGQPVWGSGHNASHTHAHNRGSSINMTHSHPLGGNMPYSTSALQNVGLTGVTSSSSYWTWAVNGGQVQSWRSTSLNATPPSVPALSIYNQGSGNTPEPNYYGIRILLKY